MGTRSRNLHTVMFLWVAPVLACAAGVCAYLTYSRVYSAILDGFDKKLSAAAATSAVFINGDDHRKLMQLSNPAFNESGKRAEESDLYKKYVTPMQRIMADGNLTYHYTIVLRDQTKIAYGLDATKGSEHSYLGTEEENPSEEAERLWRALKTGLISISPIQQFDIWGKLKIANAPIKTSSGEIAGLVGADVNISVIDRKTRLAFLQVLGAGLLSLVLAGIITWFVAHRLAVPLRRLKDSALKIGGGDFDVEAESISQPELLKLGQSLSSLGQSLKNSPLCMLHSGTRKALQRADLTIQTADDPLTVAQAATLALSEKIRILSQFQPFTGLSKHELLIVAQAASFVTYRPEALVCERGNIPPFLLVIEEGSITGDTRSPIAKLVGFESLLFEVPLDADLRAGAEGARCILIQKEHLFTMLHECPVILASMIESRLGGRL